MRSQMFPIVSCARLEHCELTQPSGAGTVKYYTKKQCNKLSLPLWNAAATDVLEAKAAQWMAKAPSILQTLFTALGGSDGATIPKDTFKTNIKNRYHKLYSAQVGLNAASQKKLMPIILDSTAESCAIDRLIGALDDGPDGPADGHISASELGDIAEYSSVEEKTDSFVSREIATLNMELFEDELVSCGGSARRELFENTELELFEAPGATAKWEPSDNEMNTQYYSPGRQLTDLQTGTPTTTMTVGTDKGRSKKRWSLRMQILMRISPTREYKPKFWVGLDEIQKDILAANSPAGDASTSTDDFSSIITPTTPAATAAVAPMKELMALAVIKDGIYLNAGIFDYPIVVRPIDRSKMRVTSEAVRDFETRMQGFDCKYHSQTLTVTWDKTLHPNGPPALHDDCVITHLALDFMWQLMPCAQFNPADYNKDDQVHSDGTKQSRLNKQWRCQKAVEGLFDRYYRTTTKLSPVFWVGNGANWISKYEAINLAFALASEQNELGGNVKWTSLEGGLIGFALDLLTNPSRWDIDQYNCLLFNKPRGDIPTSNINNVMYTFDLEEDLPNWKCGDMQILSPDAPNSIWDAASAALAVKASMTTVIPVVMRGIKRGSVFWTHEIPELAKKSLHSYGPLRVLLLWPTYEACMSDKATGFFYFLSQNPATREWSHPEQDTQDQPNPYYFDCTRSCERYINDFESPFRVEFPLKDSTPKYTVLSKLQASLIDDQTNVARGALQIFCHSLEHDGGTKMDGENVVGALSAQQFLPNKFGKKDDWTGHVCQYIDCKNQILKPIFENKKRTKALEILSKQKPDTTKSRRWADINQKILDPMRLLRDKAVENKQLGRKPEYPYIFQTFNLKRFNIKREGNPGESPEKSKLKDCLLNHVLRPTQRNSFVQQENKCDPTTFTGGRAKTSYPKVGKKCQVHNNPQPKWADVQVFINIQSNDLENKCYYLAAPQAYGKWNLVWQYPDTWTDPLLN